MLVLVYISSCSYLSVSECVTVKMLEFSVWKKTEIFTVPEKHCLYLLGKTCSAPLLMERWYMPLL